MADTNEQTKSYIAGLLEERGFAQTRLHGAELAVKAASTEAEKGAAADAAAAEKARLKGIGAELSRMGHEAKKPAARAEKRPAKAKGEKR